MTAIRIMIFEEPKLFLQLSLKFSFCILGRTQNHFCYVSDKAFMVDMTASEKNLAFFYEI